jgi:hypothetical protein
MMRALEMDMEERASAGVLLREILEARSDFAYAELTAEHESMMEAECANESDSD